MMGKARLWRGLVAALLTVGALLVGAGSAQAGPSDPLFVFALVPPPEGIFPLPPPTGLLEGPCGMGVDPAGRFYVSDYYHDTVDAYDQNADYTIPPPPAKPPTGATGYLGQLAGVDSLDGPCGLAFDAASRLYVNDYHRAVKRYGALGSFGAATTITGATVDGTHPTGVAVDPSTGYVYVDDRDHVAVFQESGEAVMSGPPGSEEPLQIGEGTLQDGYGIAYSQYPATQGYLYVPDAGSNTVKVYDPATDTDNPIEEINAADTPKGEFVSLRDASIAVDRLTGEIYVIDDLQPVDAERPQAVVYVFSSTGAYEGHLKSLVTDGMPSGLAVDNSATATQGRVYVTSGNTAFGSIYAYGPGAATTAPIALASAAPGPAGPGAAQGEEATAAGPGAAALPESTLEGLGTPAAEGAARPPAPLKRRSARARRKPKARHRKAQKKHPAHRRGVRRAR